MNTAELKLELFRKIDLLEGDQLNELSGVVENIIHQNIDLDEWNSLPRYQREGIMAGLEDLKTNGGLDHALVMAKLRKRISNA